MAEYVVCSSCGARIKATRQRCLRCLEPLHGDESPSYPSLSLSRVQTLALAGGVSLAVLALVVVLWWTRPPEDDPVQPCACRGTGAAMGSCDRRLSRGSASVSRRLRDAIQPGARSS